MPTTIYFRTCADIHISKCICCLAVWFSERVLTREYYSFRWFGSSWRREDFGQRMEAVTEVAGEEVMIVFVTSLRTFVARHRTRERERESERRKKHSNCVCEWFMCVFVFMFALMHVQRLRRRRRRQRRWLQHQTPFDGWRRLPWQTVVYDAVWCFAFSHEWIL